MKKAALIPCLLLLAIVIQAHPTDDYNVTIRINKISIDGVEVSEGLPHFLEFDFNGRSEIVKILDQAGVELGVQCVVDYEEDGFLDYRWIVYEKHKNKWRQVLDGYNDGNTMSGAMMMKEIKLRSKEGKKILYMDYYATLTKV